MTMKNLQGNKISIIEIRDRPPLPHPPPPPPTAKIKLQGVTLMGPALRLLCFFLFVVFFFWFFAPPNSSFVQSRYGFVVNTTDILAHVQSTK